MGEMREDVTGWSEGSPCSESLFDIEAAFSVGLNVFRVQTKRLSKI